MTSPRKSARVFFLRRADGIPEGPYNSDELRRLADSGDISPTDHISEDCRRWCLAARVGHLFCVVESAIAEYLPPGKSLRDLTNYERAALLIDRFVLTDKTVLAAIPVIKPIRVFVSYLFLPRHITIAQSNGNETRYSRFDTMTGESDPVTDQAVDREREEWTGHRSWMPLTAFVIACLMTWLASKTGSFGVGTFVALIGGTVTSYCKLRDVWGTRLVVGYDMDGLAKARLAAVSRAMGALSSCGNVWHGSFARHRDVHEWKRSGGTSLRVSRLPAAVFARKAPRVSTNVRVNGLTLGGRAVYFLPDRIMISRGGEISHVGYDDVVVGLSDFEYADFDGDTFPDAEVVCWSYRLTNTDGTADRRKKHNPKDVPVYLFCRVTVCAGDHTFELLVTDPSAAVEFRNLLSDAVKPAREEEDFDD